MSHPSAGASRGLNRGQLGQFVRQVDADRFYARVDKRPGDGCHLWMGRTDEDGYGLFDVNGRTVRAHHWAFEAGGERIPLGHQLDHTCNVRACVKRAHLEPVTHRENLRRRDARRRGGL